MQYNLFSLVLQFTEGKFNEDQESTIGIDLRTKTKYCRGNMYKVAPWDTAGQERFRCVTPMYYRGALGVLMVYDCSNRKSFTQLSKWIGEINAYCNMNIVKMVVGNKCD